MARRGGQTRRRRNQRGRRQTRQKGGWPWSRNASPIAPARPPSLSAPARIGNSRRSSVKGVLNPVQQRPIQIESAPLEESIAYLQEKVKDLDRRAPRLLSQCNTNLQKYFDAEIKKLQETKEQLTSLLTKTAKPTDQIPQCSNWLPMYGGQNTTPFKEYMQDLGKLRVEIASFNGVAGESTKISDDMKGRIAAMTESIIRGNFEPEKIKTILESITLKESAPVPPQDVSNVRNQSANAVGPYSVL